MTGRARSTLALLAGCAVFVATAASADAFVPDDRLYPYQGWYLERQLDAFGFWPDGPPTTLPPVRVAVIDSGVDGTHPDLRDRIVGSRSFIGGSPLVDTNGHGTFVAGEIAAVTDNGIGIAGVALSAELLIAKVADSEGNVKPADEAKAIRWAVRQGAQVINLSLAASRDPKHPRWHRNALEASAVAYARQRGVIVVAAVGNCSTRAPCPAGYPAALPGVIGVGAIDPNGRPASFTPRDEQYVDILAPGVSVVSTIPIASSAPGCANPGYSPCADRPRLLNGTGTSFAAPLVTGAVALVLAVGGLPEVAPVKASQQVRQLLATTAQPAAAGPDDPRAASGILDIGAALRHATGQASGSPIPPVVLSSG